MTRPGTNSHSVIDGKNVQVSEKTASLSLSIAVNGAVTVFTEGHRTNPFSGCIITPTLGRSETWDVVPRQLLHLAPGHC